MNITIKPLSPDLIDDYLSLFDNMEFTENPDWSACYCFSFHFTGKNEEWNRDSNRSSVIKYINEAKMTGYLAYIDNKPVGWCNVNNRLNYERLLKYYDFVDTNEKKICSIVCFVIRPDCRRNGIATKILEQICLDYKAKEYDYIEAYPGKGNLSVEHHYKGPLEMYKKYAFQIEKEYDDFYILRKRLK